MADRVVSMEVRLAIAAFAMVDDGSANVSQVCKELDITRGTYYRYRRRFEESGWVGLLPVSSRPRSSPGQTPPAMVTLIVQKRAKLLEDGWDAGARSIRYRLLRAGVPGVPSARTVHRVLVREGLVTPEPAKRPRASYRRFESASPNGCWQLDGTEWALADGTPATILRVTDDHSRMILASLACDVENSVNAWTCLETAIDRHGPPAMLLTDGGTAFSHRRQRGGIGDVEARMQAMGVNHVVASPYHPQTCGKKERDWQPLKKWLAAQPAARTLAELQRLLDAYDALFNTDRPHQALDGQVPHERFTASPKAVPADQPVTRCQITHPKVSSNGAVSLGNSFIYYIGRAWAGARLTVVRDGLDVAILHDQTILTRHRIDPTHRVQRSGRPKGRKRKVVSETS
jgi:transposase InsO family protein/transposase-like protein